LFGGGNSLILILLLLVFLLPSLGSGSIFGGLGNLLKLGS
jgi:hypothetical protein